jgi:hypothetical protein
LGRAFTGSSSRWRDGLEVSGLFAEEDFGGSRAPQSLLRKKMGVVEKTELEPSLEVGKDEGFEDSEGEEVFEVSPESFKKSDGASLADPPASVANAVVFDNRPGEGAPFLGCGVPQPVLGECGSPTLTQKSTVRGVSAGVILGNSGATTYVVQVTAGSLGPVTASYSALGGCSAEPSILVTSSFLVNELGENINAAKAGEEFRRPIEATLYYSRPEFEVLQNNVGDFFLRYKSTVKWVRTTGTVSFSVTEGGLVSPASFVGAGTYQTRVRTSPTPGGNEVSVEATEVSAILDVVDRETGVVSELSVTRALQKTQWSATFRRSSPRTGSSRPRNRCGTRTGFRVFRPWGARSRGASPMGRTTISTCSRSRFSELSRAPDVRSGS